jgi:uncharacterized protein
MSSRISATVAATELINQLIDQHGPIVFLQSGGCCEGSSPLCLPAPEFRKSTSDVKIGEVSGAPFYMSDHQFEFSKNTHTLLDAVPGSSGSFSLECGSGYSFITQARLYSDEELATLPPIET